MELPYIFRILFTFPLIFLKQKQIWPVPEKVLQPGGSGNARGGDLAGSTGDVGCAEAFLPGGGPESDGFAVKIPSSIEKDMLMVRSRVDLPSPHFL